MGFSNFCCVLLSLHKTGIPLQTIECSLQKLQDTERLTASNLDRVTTRPFQEAIATLPVSGPMLEPRAVGTCRRDAVRSTGLSPLLWHAGVDLPESLFFVTGSSGASSLFGLFLRPRYPRKFVTTSHEFLCEKDSPSSGPYGPGGPPPLL